MHFKSIFKEVGIQLPSEFLFVTSILTSDKSGRCIHRLINILTSPEVYGTYVRLPTSETPISTKITRSTILHTFKDCVGALDGTHILAHVPEEKRGAYRNWKAQLSQNVLAACDMDMKFIYILSGWEGSAADSRVFEDARSTDFVVPEGRYYLGDAGYAISDLLLVPYRGVRYHIKEWGQTRQRYVHVLASIRTIHKYITIPDLGITRSSSTIDMHYFETI